MKSSCALHSPEVWDVTLPGPRVSLQQQHETLHQVDEAAEGWVEGSAPLLLPLRSLGFDPPEMWEQGVWGEGWPSKYAREQEGG